MKSVVQYLSKLSPESLGVVALVLPFLTSVVAIGFFYAVVEHLNARAAEEEMRRLTRLSAEHVTHAVIRGLDESVEDIQRHFALESSAMRANLPGLRTFDFHPLEHSEPAESRAAFEADVRHRPLLENAVAEPDEVHRMLANGEGEGYLSFAKAVTGREREVVGVLRLEYDLSALAARLLPVREAALFATLIALLLCYAISRLSTNLRRSSLISIEEQNRAADLMREARDQAERARQAETELLAIAAHDLKNPLSAVRGFCQMIERRLDRGEPHMAREMTQRVAETTQSLLHMVENLLARAALGQNGFRLHNEIFDFREVVEETFRLNSLAARRKQITLAVRAPEPGCVEGDRVRLCEAVDNLVNNAVKYSPLGSLVEIRVDVDETQVHLSVADEGPGLTNEDLSLAFQQFQRLSARPTGGESSIGLGLSICKTIIDAHGGEVGCHNRTKGGSVFFTRLPRSKGPPRPANIREDVPELSTV
ncbi:MAG: sensor histidine kinase [Opitutales bacterium]